jgi:hypothetical protein
MPRILSKLELPFLKRDTGGVRLVFLFLLRFREAETGVSDWEASLSVGRLSLDLGVVGDGTAGLGGVSAAAAACSFFSEAVFILRSLKRATNGQ